MFQNCSYETMCKLLSSFLAKEEKEEEKSNYQDKNVMFNYIDETSKLEISFSKIFSCKTVAINCKGDNISRKGILSLIQISTDSNEIFVYDYQKLKSELMIFLKELLSREDILKLGYDFRNFADLLINQFGSTINNLLDVQLLVFWDSTSLEVFSPDLPKQLKGLIQIGKLFSRDICLISLQSYCALEVPFLKSLESFDSFKRPLPENYIAYAGVQTTSIMKIYSKIKFKLDTDLKNKFIKISKAYYETIALKKERGYLGEKQDEIVPIHIFSNNLSKKECKLCKENIPIDMINDAGNCFQCQMKTLCLQKELKIKSKKSNDSLEYCVSDDGGEGNVYKYDSDCGSSDYSYGDYY